MPEEEPVTTMRFPLTKSRMIKTQVGRVFDHGLG
jgi:hypothetical protein